MVVGQGGRCDLEMDVGHAETHTRTRRTAVVANIFVKVQHLLVTEPGSCSKSSGHSAMKYVTVRIFMLLLLMLDVAVVELGRKGAVAKSYGMLVSR